MVRSFRKSVLRFSLPFTPFLSPEESKNFENRSRLSWMLNCRMLAKPWIATGLATWVVRATEYWNVIQLFWTKATMDDRNSSTSECHAIYKAHSRLGRLLEVPRQETSFSWRTTKSLKSRSWLLKTLNMSKPRWMAQIKHFYTGEVPGRQLSPSASPLHTFETTKYSNPQVSFLIGSDYLWALRRWIS